MCMIDIVGGDSGPYFGERKRVARKEHLCGDCYEKIGSGETYTIGSGIYEGRFWSAKQCSNCMVAARWLQRYCRGFLFGGVWDDIAEHVEAWFDLENEQQDELVVTLEKCGETDMLETLLCEI